MGSYYFGKPEVCQWIRENFKPDATILDVGACDGRWRMLLPEYENMDAVEIWEPNAKRLNGYRKVFNADIRTFKYRRYSLIIFGDIIEHLSPKDAAAVLEYAKPRCRDFIIAVPFLYKQGAIDGNPHEIHIQDDLTPELFDQRFPGLHVLCDPGHDYRYYHK